MKIPRLATLLLALAPFASAAMIGQIDTFQSGTTEGWFAGGLGFAQVPPVPPFVSPNGGPLGVGDQYLVITSQGGNGPGSRLTAMNLAQWAGDYLSAGIIGIGLDLNNFGASDLTIRLLFEDPMGGPPADEAVTTMGFFLPGGSGWTHAVFPIAPSDFTVLSGDINTLLGNTTLIRIIHADAADEAEPIAGLLGVDNITAIPEPATLFMAGLSLTGLALWRRKSTR